MLGTSVLEWQEAYSQGSPVDRNQASDLDLAYTHEGRCMIIFIKFGTFFRL